jgi:hypothetical protein
MHYARSHRITLWQPKGQGALAAFMDERMRLADERMDERPRSKSTAISAGGCRYEPDGKPVGHTDEKGVYWNDDPHERGVSIRCD